MCWSALASSAGAVTGLHSAADFGGVAVAEEVEG